jgi:hypothetical protein
MTASTSPGLAGDGRAGPWPRGGLTSAPSCSRHECNKFFFVFVPVVFVHIYPFEIAMVVVVVVVVCVGVAVVVWCGAFVGRGRVVIVVVCLGGVVWLHIACRRVSRESSSRMV